MEHTHSHQITDAAAARAFALAGNARLTLVSRKTGARFTYRVRKSQDGRVHFVSVLTGSDNESSFTYLGIIRDMHFQVTAKSKISKDAPSARGFDFFWFLAANSRSCPDLEVWHEGRCGRCGRALTVPSSIKLGIGPECASIMGIDSDRSDDEASYPATAALIREAQAGHAQGYAAEVAAQFQPDDDCGL